MFLEPNPIVEVRNVSREFLATRGRRSSLRFIRSWMGRQIGGSERLKALDDVSFTLASGEKLGVIGNNAAGKSTLLKVIAGLLRPTRGAVHVEGEMILLTALGVGMMDELTVEENVILYGAIYGLDRRQMRSLLSDIVEWAEMERYRGAKLRTLSSGTRARLAFSVVRHIEAEVFLLDEALSAGDVGFQQKCRQHFESPKAVERTYIVASHDMNFVRSFCSKALWLCEGRQAALGESNLIVDAYLASQSPAVEVPYESTPIHGSGRA